MKDSLGDRMKRFENTRRDVLMPRMPTIIRIDGKAFHTYTKQMNFTFPFDDYLHAFMGYTALSLFENVQNARLCYFQSDEISILLNDWGTYETEQWFGGNIQKITSVSASEATAAFIKAIMIHQCSSRRDELLTMPLPKFDSRVWQIPKEEVSNYFLWRQQDATRNSLQMLGRAHFSHKQMHKKNTSDIHDMLHEIGINWNDLETWKRRGACIKGGEYDGDIPIFSANRSYIEELL